MKLPTKWPFRVRVGNTTIPVYHAKRTKRGFEYDEFKVAWYDADGARKFKAFTGFAEAEAHAKAVAESIRDGDVKTLTLKGEERLVYLRALDALSPLQIPLDTAAQGFAEQFLKEQSRLSTSKTVEEVVAELIEEKNNPSNRGRRPASPDYLRHLKHTLKGVVGVFGARPVVSITEAEVERYLAGLKVGRRTWLNHARAARTLCRFALKRKYVLADCTAGLDLHYEDDGEVSVYRPAQMRAFLEKARPEMVPFLALAGFAGVRHEEIRRLHWEDIGAEVIDIKASKSKTRSRRQVPIQPNLAAWLAGCRKKGPVMTLKKVSSQFAPLSLATGIDWKQNALRHSFISYRLAVLKNENIVALEAGNSPAKVFSNYRAVVTEKMAEEWFGIFPPQN